jgi:hypothetical protein
MPETQADERAAMDAAMDATGWLGSAAEQIFEAAWQARAEYDARTIEALRAAATLVVDGYDRALGKREMMERMNALAAALAPAETGEGEPYLHPFIAPWMAQETRHTPLPDPPAADEGEKN